MKYYYLKRKHPINKDTPLYIHFGIPRTGSSTVRHLIRRYCNLMGYSWRAFDVNASAEQQQQLIAESHYLLVEEPYIAHIMTDRPYYYVTTVRPPVDQLISLYSWHINREHTRLPIDSYIDQLPDSLNFTCRWLSLLQERMVFDDMRSQHLLPEAMFGEKSFYYPINDDALFEKAKLVIDKHFHIAASLDQMPGFAFALAELAQWAVMPFNMRVNYSVKSKPFSLDMLPDKSLEKLKHCTAADSRLVDYVTEKFSAVENNLKDKYAEDFSLYLDSIAVVESKALSAKGYSLVGQSVVPGDVVNQEQAGTSVLENSKHIFHGEDHLDFLDSL